MARSTGSGSKALTVRRVRIAFSTSTRPILAGSSPRQTPRPLPASGSSPACGRPGGSTSGTGSGRSRTGSGSRRTYECIYSVVDLHALTTGFEDVSRIHEDGIEMLADWIGAGVDPERSIVFRQSQVPEHAELALLLGMITPKSWLERVPTYKGQIAELGRADRHLRLLRLPAAADGRHHPLPRDQGAGGPGPAPSSGAGARGRAPLQPPVRGRGEEVFPEPEALLTEAPILLGIDNRKMSKSYGNAIELGAAPDTIRDMVGRMITDPQKIRRGDPGRPGDLQRVLLREAVRHAGRAGRGDRPHLPHRRARLPRPQGRDLRADRGVPAPVPRAPRAGAGRPRRAGADPGPRAPSAPARSRCRTWSARRRRWGCDAPSSSHGRSWISTSSRGRSTCSSR